MGAPVGVYTHVPTCAPAFGGCMLDSSLDLQASELKVGDPSLPALSARHTGRLCLRSSESCSWAA